MLTNKTVLFTAAVAFAQQAMAVSPRHMHQHLEKKRAWETDYVTHWVTVHVTAGQEPQPDPTPVVVDDSLQQPADDPKPTVKVVVTTQAPAPPPPASTTLVKKPKPTSDNSNGGNDDNGNDNSNSDGDNTSPFPGKRGLCYNDASLANSMIQGCDGCGWGYNWGAQSDGLDSSFNYVPMLWGGGEHAQGWDEAAEKAISAGSKAMLSFNEPDIAAQANMTPEEAAAAHKQYMNKYSGKVKIGAPAVSNSGSTDQGLDWLKKFFAACDAQDGGCAVDFCPIHWYSPAQYADTLYTQIEDAHTVCGNRPIWLTEFAPQGSDAEKAQFMKDVIPELEKISYLHAYSYFMVGEGNLMSGGILSTIGKLYATVF